MHRCGRVWAAATRRRPDRQAALSAGPDHVAGAEAPSRRQAADDDQERSAARTVEVLRSAMGGEGGRRSDGADASTNADRRGARAGAGGQSDGTGARDQEDPPVDADPHQELTDAGAGGAVAADAGGWALRAGGWGGWIRTTECRLQRPMPYHLATPQSRSQNPRRVNP